MTSHLIRPRRLLPLPLQLLQPPRRRCDLHYGVGVQGGDSGSIGGLTRTLFFPHMGVMSKI